MAGKRITVQVKYLVSLADKTGKRAEDVALEEDSTLEDFAGWLRREREIALPDPSILTVLNGKGWNQYPDKLHTRLNPGDTILLFPPISGG